MPCRTDQESSNQPADQLDAIDRLSESLTKAKAVTSTLSQGGHPQPLGGLAWLLNDLLLDIESSSNLLINICAPDDKPTLVLDRSRSSG